MGCLLSFFLLFGILSNTLPSHLYWWWKAPIFLSQTPPHPLSTPFSESISPPNALFFVGLRGGGGGLHRQSTQAARLPKPSPPALSSTLRPRRFRRTKQKRLDAIRDFAGGPAPSESTPLRRLPPARRAPRGRSVGDLRESRGIGLKYQELEDGGKWGLRLRSWGKVSGSSASKEKSKRRLFDDEVEFFMPVKRKKVVKIAHCVDETNPDQFVVSPVVRKEEDVIVDCSEKLDASMEDAANVCKEDVVDDEADRLDSDKMEEPVPRGEEGGRLENDKLEEVAPSGDAGLVVVGECVEQGDGGNEGIAPGKNEELK